MSTQQTLNGNPTTVTTPPVYAPTPTPLKAPFPWFGGKRRVATQVWDAIGDVHHYIEPFAGSLAVILGRPNHHHWDIETVNDKDQYVANFWRAVTHDPDSVAAHCDWPVNEADLFARHLWLVNTGRERLQRMRDDPDYYDAKVAGWWVWGINSWIGGEWCAGKGPHKHSDNDTGQGVKSILPLLGPPRGVNRKQNRDDIVGYLKTLATRMRRVRVCCGDWARVVTTGATTVGDTVGVFLDPPYDVALRDPGLYAVDDHHVAVDVREWAINNGDNPRFRIVLAGYEPEHINHIPDTWRMHAYKASVSYQRAAGGTQNETNRHLERLWYSPHCLPQTTPTLF